MVVHLLLLKGSMVMPKKNFEVLVPARRAQLPERQPVAVQVVVPNRWVRLVREIEAAAKNVL